MIFFHAMKFFRVARVLAIRPWHGPVMLAHGSGAGALLVLLAFAGIIILICRPAAGGGK